MNEKTDDQSSVVMDSLARFGLSKDEASLFLMLSRVNKNETYWMKGLDISQLSMKSRVRTYQILQGLVSQGLVKVDLSRPKKYSAVSPQVALRRLISTQESKLSELSHLEKETITAIRDLKPISIGSILGKEEENQAISKVSLLQGLANIQTALREALAGADVKIVVNEESIEHIFTVLSFVSERLRSAKIILSSRKRFIPVDHSFSLTNIDHLELFRRGGQSPTFIVTDEFTMFLFYSKSKTKKKLLSPQTTFNTASQLILIDSKTYSTQMASVFELMLNGSTRVDAK